MKEKLKIIAKKIFLLLSIPMIIGGFVFAHSISQKEVCKGINIYFENNEYSFVTKQNINEFLKEKNIHQDKTKLSEINIRNIEKEIEENKWIKNADIYIDANYVLNINIKQKEPLIRIQPENDFEDPYYLDENANIIPYSSQYIPDLPVATATELAYTSKDLELKRDLVKIANFLNHDTFWNVAITQISVNPSGQIELTPAIGKYTILIGDASDLEYKMAKLFEFYKQGLEKVNWSKYDEIDLRFEKQIVCRNTRGERLSIDPYDKDASKKGIEKPKENNAIASSAPIVNKVNTITQPVKTQDVSTKKNEPKEKISTPQINQEKAPKDVAIKMSTKEVESKKVIETPKIKSETIVKKQEKKWQNKNSTEEVKQEKTKETKKEITEVKHSKFFNEN